MAEQFADLRDESDIRARISSVAGKAGYGSYMLAYVNPAVSERQWIIDNYPDLEVTDGAERDPLLKLVRSRAETVIWGPDLYHDNGASDIWESAHGIGLHSGISCPIRPGGERRMTLALMRDREFDGTQAQLSAQAGEFERLAHMLAGIVMSLYDERVEAENCLTTMEREALQWVFEGFNLYDIAAKLRLGAHDTRLMLQATATKLGVATPVEAAMRAARLGVLDTTF